MIVGRFQKNLILNYFAGFTFTGFFTNNFLLKSNKIGVATQSEEYVPMTTPINNANKNPLIAGPPKKNMINNTTNNTIDVLKVLLNVVFNELLIIEAWSSVT